MYVSFRIGVQFASFMIVVLETVGMPLTGNGWIDGLLRLGSFVVAIWFSRRLRRESQGTGNPDLWRSLLSGVGFMGGFGLCAVILDVVFRAAYWDDAHTGFWLAWPLVMVGFTIAAVLARYRNQY